MNSVHLAWPTPILIPFYADLIAFIPDTKLSQLFTDLVLADFLVTYTPFVSQVVFQYVKHQLPSMTNPNEEGVFLKQYQSQAPSLVCFRRPTHRLLSVAFPHTSTCYSRFRFSA